MSGFLGSHAPNAYLAEYPLLFLVCTERNQLWMPQFLRKSQQLSNIDASDNWYWSSEAVGQNIHQDLLRAA